MKKLIALLAVLGIFSLNTMALPVPSSVAQATSGQASTGDTVKMQKTSLAMQVAISDFVSHAEEDSWNADENRIAELIMNEELMDQVADIELSFVQEISKLENVEVTSEEEAAKILEELGNSLLNKIRANKSLSEITQLFLKNQKAYPINDLDFDVALSFTYSWVAQMYGLAEEAQ